MDGNGRWAQNKGRPRTYGHIKGARVAKKIISTAAELKIRYLTLYAFSTENWLRPASEVQFLMSILKRYLKKETANLVNQNIRFSVIGDINRLPGDLISIINSTVQKTSHCSGMNLVFALSYGSRNEITDTTKILCQKVLNGEIQISDISEFTISNHLSTAPAPDVDLIIRTSGEKRLSNFLLWQAAYSELYFSNTLWPDFSKKEFIEILKEFSSRERRFGQVKSTHEQPSC